LSLTLVLSKRRRLPAVKFAPEAHENGVSFIAHGIDDRLSLFQVREQTGCRPLGRDGTLVHGKTH